MGHLQGLNIRRRPVDEKCLRGNGIQADRAKVAGVERIDAIVPHHPNAALGHGEGVADVVLLALVAYVDRLGGLPEGVGLIELDAINDDVTSLYRLDQLKGGSTADMKKDLGPLPKASKVLLFCIAAVWVLLGVWNLRVWLKKRAAENK